MTERWSLLPDSSFQLLPPSLALTLRATLAQYCGGGGGMQQQVVVVKQHGHHFQLSLQR